MEEMGSKVYLVGAGPGDVGLITVRGLELVERADVIVYDYLSSDGFLRHAKPGAEVIYVGKKGFGEHVSQDEINALLVRLGRGEVPGAAPRTIVRLKGGDPFVFGRGGEEALALREAGVPFEVVPGVTSGLAAPAYAGIPVTQRKVASSVTLVTGREDPTREESGIDWAALAALAARGDTICFYMGVRSLPVIAERLVAAGLDAATPAAAVRWGTTARQETLTATLGAIAGEAERVGLASPAIIVVGRTVALRERVAWCEERPLFGKTVLCTRSAGQAAGLARALGELGAEVACVPALAFADPDDGFAALDEGIRALGGYDWVVFTSANGVERFFARLTGAHGKDARALAGARVAAIGPATAAALARHGIGADVVPASYRAEGVFEAMRDAAARDGRGSLAGARVLVPRAQVAREVLPDLLRGDGARVDVAPAYKTVLLGEDAARGLRDALDRGDVDAVTFTSSSTVRNCVAMLAGDASRLLGSADLFSIGPVTSATLREHGLEPAAEAGEYTIAGLVRAIEGYYRT